MHRVAIPNTFDQSLKLRGCQNCEKKYYLASSWQPRVKSERHHLIHTYDGESGDWIRGYA
jgi:hypothetical protein